MAERTVPYRTTGLSLKMMRLPACRETGGKALAEKDQVIQEKDNTIQEKDCALQNALKEKDSKKSRFSG